MPTQAVKPQPLHQIFTDVPPRYDLINSIFTWGMDKKWRQAAIRACLANSPRRVLDLCCGTGDLTIGIAAAATGDVEVTGLDFSKTMLEQAQRKAAAAGSKVTFINGNAANLPFPDEYFDSIGISFAFRNLTYQNSNADRHLAEILRVLKPGGRFVAVESSQPRHGFIRILDHIYLHTFVFLLGWLVSGNRRAYKYLTSSAANYYTAEALRDLLRDTGFSEVSFRRLFYGAAAIHVAIK